ncbi:hypothetical protein L218DRAFT_564766 [Marasmius fiardii PR-910]|nr:hypothetical protein L218DRAFT_564766 [Marasmius fiardii PR-910]
MSELHIRLIAATSFVLGTAFQLTGFLVEQSWKTYPFPSLSYSVHPYFLYGAFTIQLGLQLWWLLKPNPRIRLLEDEGDSQGGCLFHVEGAGLHFQERPITEKHSLFIFTDRVSYIPIFTFVNNCFILWTIAFQCKLLVPAIIILSASACVQYSSILATESQSHLVSGDRLTAAIAKLNTAYTVLLLAKTSAAYQVRCSGRFRNQSYPFFSHTLNRPF